jgi:uncharacterized membrane protein
MRASLRLTLVAAVAALGTAVAEAPAAESAAPAAAPTAAPATSGSTAAPAAAPAETASAPTDPTPEAAKDPEPAKAPEPEPAAKSDEPVNEPTPDEPKRELHGSQVASSQWLPITIGGGIGLIAGVVVGQAVDPSQPVLWGPIVGGVVGGLTGGAGGAWLIRGLRGEDTRLAGAMTGLGLGGGLGFSLAAHTDNLYGKIAACVLFPAAGALVGHRLAFVIGRKEEKRPRFAMVPTAAPVVVEGRGASGLVVGVSGVIF